MTQMITISDWVIAGATLLGPIIAVRITRWLDDRKEKRDRKFYIFNTLMATRAYPFTLEHVGALNRIDVEFSSNDDKNITDAWKAYHDHLGNKMQNTEVWSDKTNTLFTDLLFEMSKNLGYSYDKTYIKNMSYAPQRHGIIESEQDKLRATLLSLFQGGSVPITITNFPTAQNNEPQQDQIKEAI